MFYFIFKEFFHVVHFYRDTSLQKGRIFGCLKILSMISRQKRLKRIVVFFYLDRQKKSFKEIYFCNENLKKNDAYKQL